MRLFCEVDNALLQCIFVGSDLNWFLLLQPGEVAVCVCACIVVRGSRRVVGTKSQSARLSVATVVYLVQVLSGSPLSSASLSSRSNKLRKSRIIRYTQGDREDMI